MAASAPLARVNEDDRDACVDLAELLIDLQPGLVGQAQIEQDDIRRLGSGLPQPLRPDASHLDLVVRSRERLTHLVEDRVGVVINEEQASHVAFRTRVWAGLSARRDRSALYSLVGRSQHACPAELTAARDTPTW